MKKGDQDIWREALRATSVGWDLALPIFGGVLIGYLLDRVLDTTYIFTLGLLILGVVTGYYNVIRSIQRMEQRSSRRATDEGKETENEEEG